MRNPGSQSGSEGRKQRSKDTQISTLQRSGDQEPGEPETKVDGVLIVKQKAEKRGKGNRPKLHEGQERSKDKVRLQEL